MVKTSVNLMSKIKKYLSKGKKNKTKRRRRTNSKQNGGVGFSPDVSACRIGGLPEIVPTSDCPKGAGPGSAEFAKALYGMKGGAKRKRHTKRRSAKRRSTKRRSGGC